MVKRSKNYSYGERPLWQKIVLYLVVGVIVYGAVYFAYFSKKVTYASLGSIEQSTAQYNYAK
ncbi:MAG TPA: hypothetical protein VMR81_02685 [Patescibacteria group bacterium]|jgi:Tfp pilus assembly protein PilO|nr:hypothetical protein [Patescibacteria group bacterium]